MCIRRLFAAGAMGWLAVSSAGAEADAIQDLETRVEQLEVNQEDQAAREQHLVNVSGYADVQYNWFQKINEHPGFQINHVSLFFQKNFAEKWRFFSEVEFENAPRVEIATFDTPSSLSGGGEIFLEAANFDYMYDPRVNLRVGRFFTPAGIWSVDHYTPFVPTQKTPELFRRIFPGITDGADVFGTLQFGRTFTEYDVYVGNGDGEDNPGSGDMNNSKERGIRFNLKLPLVSQFDVGGTYFQNKMNDGTQQNAYGLHGKVRAYAFTVQFEYADGKLEPVVTGSYHDKGWYTQLLYDWRSWTFGYRYDTFKSSSVEDVVTNSVILNYHINPTMVIKLEHHLVDNKVTGAVDYGQTILSIAAFLGN